MNRMILTTISILAAALLGMGCSDKDNPVLTDRNLDETATYFASSDDKKSDTFYKPAVGYVADPMPFFDPVAGDYKIMYLQDYHPNHVSRYHPLWAVSTKDAASYVSLGELVSCGGEKEQDAAIGTGCVVYNSNDKLYYTFYTGNKYKPTAEECGQVVMYATSPDFKTWTKNMEFFLKGPEAGYSASDFRDPHVFTGDDGRFHMLVSTKKDGKGVLAEYVSDDMKTWNHVGVFMTMMWDRFYECPDLFKMGDWWYLVYSEMHNALRKVQYFKGKTLDELKACTANDAGLWPDYREGFLDGRGFYAGKTASDGTDRYIWGWNAYRPGSVNTEAYDWGGNLVAHKLVQNTDGTLCCVPVPAVAEKFAGKSVKVEMKASSETGVTFDNSSAEGASCTLAEGTYALFNRRGTYNCITFKVKTSSDTDKFGMSFVRGTDSQNWYSFICQYEDWAGKRKVNFENEGEGGKGFIDGSDSVLFPDPENNEFNVTIYTDNSVVTIYINNELAYTTRVYGLAKNPWSINCYAGNIEVVDLKVAEY